MSAQAQDTNSIIATKVPGNRRMSFLPKYAGKHFMRFEPMVYQALTQLAGNSGGMWMFYELSNGGFYMAPRGHDEMALSSSDNFFEGTVSGDAAGIIACLYALCRLWEMTEDDAIAEHYHALRDFAMDHAEAGAIFGAIN